LVLDVIGKGAAQSWQMDNRGKTMVENKFDFGFAVDWMRKDLGLCLDEARRNGAPLPATALIDQFYGDVQAAGGGRHDTSSLIRRLRKAGLSRHMPDRIHPSCEPANSAVATWLSALLLATGLGAPRRSRSSRRRQRCGRICRRVRDPARWGASYGKHNVSPGVLAAATRWKVTFTPPGREWWSMRVRCADIGARSKCAPRWAATCALWRARSWSTARSVAMR
jgi:hypothetical protein